MTKMLASVTGVDEARLALEYGADFIDLKNPAEGALGGLPLSVISQVVAALAGVRPVSATIGDLPMQPELIAAAIAGTAETGVDIIKVGLFGRSGHAECIDAIAPLAARGVRVIAVLFADGKPDFTLLPMLASAGFHGVMLDTASKSGMRLVDFLGDQVLRDFVQSSRALGLLTGLAGSLSAVDVAPLAAIGPDYLGFRGALCENSDRQTSLDATRLQRVAELLYLHNINTIKAA